MVTQQTPINSGFGVETTPEQVMEGIQLGGKVAIVTGGHSGIGLETTKALVKAGATVVVGAHNIAKAKDVLSGLENVEAIELNLADPASVDTFATAYLSEHKHCDILINNAGIMATPLERDSRGYELQFATNHLGHFQLTTRLWDALAAAGAARVVALSSLGHRFSAIDFDDPNYLNRTYDPWQAYGQSKTANALFAVQLDRIGKDAGIRAFAVHPGRIPTTNLSRFMSDEEKEASKQAVPVGPNYVPSAIKTVPQGASTSLWAATSPQLAGMGGVYCADCDISPLVADDSPATNGVRRWAIDPEQAARLWELSLKLIG
ncbi:Oxidoreductase, short-chain dehydrogenase/reductase [Sphingobium indicum BiD32]|uniref:Probable oxidoreductase n=1 Tax=Sphingobium indicum BiD32 TaxID=1301087 RepID=N1MRP5_9SPHN|nr:oxidoreductase [Sphingobium indicum]CCW18327.1 Oxidoreductase, short-chain dehydrogenase/reductase [Sphingobium indicum BiD32]